MKTKLNATFEGSYEELISYIQDTFKVTSNLIFSVSISSGGAVNDRAFQKLSDISAYNLKYEDHLNRFEAAKQQLRLGNKIESIKLIREISGIGLAEAKNYVESDIFTDAASRHVA